MSVFTILSSLSPRLPGLPPLAFDALSLFGSEIAAVDALNPINFLFGKPPPVWGIFDSEGNAIVIPDTVVSFDYKNDAKVSMYPVEQGAFQSFNKVSTPFDARMLMVRSGTESDRADFLTALQDVLNSLELLTIVTPEATYENANVVNLDYRREQKNGAYQIIAAVWLVEIRSTTGSNAADPLNGLAFAQEPSATDAVSLGQVQLVTPSGADISDIG